MNKKVYIGIGVIILLIVVIFMLSIVRYGTAETPSKESLVTEFSREAWNENPEERYKMIDDLMQKHDFFAMTKDDVIMLLGENELDIGSETLRYETHGGFFEDEILQLVFDENGKIVDVGIAN